MQRLLCLSLSLACQAAWSKNLLAKCGQELPKAIFDRLSQIMAMLKHHDESDAAFTWVESSTLWRSYTLTFLRQKAYVDDFRPY